MSAIKNARLLLSSKAGFIGLIILAVIAYGIYAVLDKETPKAEVLPSKLNLPTDDAFNRMAKKDETIAGTVIADADAKAEKVRLANAIKGIGADAVIERGLIDADKLKENEAPAAAPAKKDPATMSEAEYLASIMPPKPQVETEQVKAEQETQAPPAEPTAPQEIPSTAYSQFLMEELERVAMSDKARSTVESIVKAGGERLGASATMKNGMARQADMQPNESIPSSTVKTIKDPGAVMLKPVTKRVPKGSRYYAILESPINSDVPGPVYARIIQNGPLLNATLTGQPAQQIKDAVIVTFNSLTINNKDYAIQAIALDPKSQLTALADDVDNHTLSRWSALILSTLVRGAGEKTDTRKMVVDPSTGREVVVEQQGIDTETGIAIAAKEVSKELAPDIREYFNLKPTVTTNPNKEILVYLSDSIELETK